MSETLVTFLLTWLLWWVLLFTAYAGLLFGIDALLTAHRRRQQERQNLRHELARLDQEAAASVQRIGAAFLATQRLMREEASHGARR
ncbi:hypothetical protein [Mycolicibacterium agri]|nr:hypothetical protein [Mycolicibacterium agri]GFG50796.1 hypothetical protein MAGR_22370 [Mycolicibacterium agri]